MKAAVSIPDPIFKAADELANKMGVSRSRLYSGGLIFPILSRPTLVAPMAGYKLNSPSWVGG
jgi:hypothetical protein